MKYEITIRELTPFTEEELKEVNRNNRSSFDIMDRGSRYSDRLTHEVRVLQAEVSKEEMVAVRNAILNCLN